MIRSSPRIAELADSAPVLRVGLTGGIGAGKSTVAKRLADRGAVVIDADRVAREVVEPGTDGLREVVAAFGPGVLAADGSLDRPALAGIVFADAAARATLNGIVHPRIAARTGELIAEAAPDAIIVHDVPLLVENAMAAAYHLALVVDAPVEERIRRLTSARGLTEADARARIAAQASDEQRRAVADVWLDNGGEPEAVLPIVDALWAQRLVPFEENMRERRPPVIGGPELADYDPTWPQQADRLAARVRLAAGGLGVRVDHVGSTAVPGLEAKDVIDLQLTVTTEADLDAVPGLLATAGFLPYALPSRSSQPPVSLADSPHPAAPDVPPIRKQVLINADPQRRANLHVRVAGAPAWRYTLLFRDWLRANPAETEDYAARKQAAVRDHGGGSVQDYSAAKTPWFTQALPRAEEWATRVGWTPPST